MIAIAVIAATAAGITACGGPKTTSVSDASGLFHVVIPAKWQSMAQTGILAIYAAKDLPKDEDAAFDTLSVGIYTASAAASEPVGPRLVSLLEARAKDRKWKKQSIGQPAATKVGKREAYQVDVSGVDEKSREFAGRALLVRTNEREVLVFAVAPSGKWNGYEDDVDGLLTQWYWHQPEKTEATDTAK